MSSAPSVYLGESERGRTRSGAEPVRLLRVVGGDEPTVESAADTLSVLLVEDDPSMRLLCAYNLEADGIRVTTAETGRLGLEAARTADFDLALLDVMLPDLGGFEVAEELNGVPVVFVSARAAPEDLELGRSAGAIDYITKPFDPVELATRLREDLGQFRRGGAESVWALRFGLSRRAD